MSDSWPFLFVGALLDALIGPNLIVPGEPFLLAAGYQLHAGHISGVIAVFLGGLIGDQSSYWIGYRYGYKDPVLNVCLLVPNFLPDKMTKRFWGCPR